MLNKLAKFFGMLAFGLGGLCLASGSMAETTKVLEEKLMTNISVEKIDGEKSAWVLTADVELGSNSCTTQGLSAALALETDLKTGGLIVTPIVFGDQSTDLVCIQIYAPVFEKVTLLIQADQLLADLVILRNVPQIGEEASLGSFLPKSPRPTICPVVYPVVCTMEYNLTVCRYSGETFQGNNPCQARTFALDFACRSGRSFKEEQIRCKSSY